jgi:hypothetical protein
MRIGYNKGAVELKNHPWFNGMDWDKLVKKVIIELKHGLI